MKSLNFLLEAEAATEGFNWRGILDQVIVWLTNAGIKIVIALLIWFISFKIINRIARKIEKRGENGKYDKTLSKTLAYIIKLASKVIIIVCLVGYVGIDTSGLAALLVSAGACVGLALNGALGNLAGGILIILTRPFRVDDFIEAQGVSGTVEDIHITCTRIRTPDNKVIYVPNGALSGGNIINYSEKDTRRVDLVFNVDYSNDTKLAIELIKGEIAKQELILTDADAPFVEVTELSESSIDITTRVWVKSADYWTVKFALLNAVKAAFDANGISVPFNQLDVHIKKD